MLPVRTTSQVAAYDEGHQATVLCIDDDRAVQRGIARLLRSYGYSVETYASYKQFLSRPPLDGPGCILLDLLMPELDGLQAQTALQEAGVTLPIIFLTAHGDVPSSVTAMKGGAIDFLLKPVDEHDLRDAIERAFKYHVAVERDRQERAYLHSRYEKLTPREKEVFAAVAGGLLNKQIASLIGTTDKTVKAHRSQITRKLGIRSVAQLVRIFDRLGLNQTASPDARSHDRSMLPSNQIRIRSTSPSDT